VLVIHFSQHLVLVWSPVRELADVLPHPIVLRVEQMSAVLGHADVRLLVDVVVAVTTDVIPLLDDEGGLPELLGVSFGDYGAR